MTMFHYYRHIVATMVFLSTMVVYMGRLNLSITIVAMTHETVNDTAQLDGVCPALDDDADHMAASSKTIGDGEFDWDHSMQGLVLGSFFIGYSPFQILGGLLADRFGPRWLVFVAIFGTGVQNLLTPVFARMSVYVLIATRILLGAIQALVFPACFTLTSKWTPDHERSMVLSFTTVGGLLGSLVVSILAGYLSQHHFAGGWPGVFYVTGIINVVFSIIYVILVADNPERSRFVSPQELKFIRQHIKAQQAQSSDPQKDLVPATHFPWARMFQSKAVWAIVFARFTMHAFYNLVTLKLPAYLQQVLRMSIEDNGNFTSIVSLAMAMSHFVSGIIADRLAKSGRVSKTRVRKLFEGIGTLATAVLFCLVSLTGCDRRAFLALMVAAMLTHGTQAGGEFPIASDLTNRFSATLFGLSNAVAMSTGIILPYGIGAVLDAHPGSAQQQWWNIFYIIAGLNVIGGILFLIFARAESKGWDWLEEDTQLQVVDCTSACKNSESSNSIVVLETVK